MSRAFVPSLLLLTSLSAGSGYAQVPDDPKGEAATNVAPRSVDGGAGPAKPATAKAADTKPAETKLVETKAPKSLDPKFAPSTLVAGPTGTPAEKQKWLGQHIEQLL